MNWFSNWENLFRIFVIGVSGYMGLIAILRISGPRTLSKMNIFDFIVSIAMGSIFAAGLLQKSTGLVDVLFAIGLLVGLQFIVTSLAIRYKWFDAIIKSSPKVVYNNDQFLYKEMKSARVTEDEIRYAMRQQGFNKEDQVLLVILETNGSLAAVGK